MLALRAKYVFAIDQLPLRDGVVAIDGQRIVAVGKRTSPAMAHFSATARDLGNVAILPGLVNPHTHLEFSDLRQPLGQPGIKFSDWIRLVVQSRRQRPSASQQERIERGLAESLRHGVTSLGEIASTPWWPSESSASEVTEFVEAIAFKSASVDAKFAEISGAVSNKHPWSESFRAGISPHAPYSVHPELLRRLVQLSNQQRIPIAHHLAESKEELLLLKSGDGPMAELLNDFGQWDASAIRTDSRPLDYLKVLSEANRSLVIHGNYLEDDEIEFLAAHVDRMSVVYCPRTHAFFQHAQYPLAKMLAAGVNVAIGTDSRASTPDLNPLAEMRFIAQQHVTVAPEELLRMITAAAARALGRDADLGTLATGKFADLAIVRLTERDVVDPHELLLDSDCQAAGTIFRGKVAYAAANFDLTVGSW